MQVCLEYLERYYVLIAFTAYLFEPGFNPEPHHHQASLAQWMQRRPELYRCAVQTVQHLPSTAPTRICHMAASACLDWLHVSQLRSRL